MNERPGTEGEQGRQRESTQRLFFALWPTDDLRAVLTHATRKAVRACGGRPVPVASLHMTLAFLGSVPERCIPDVDALAREVAARSPRMELTFDRVEHWVRPQLLCATVSAQVPQAIALSAALKGASESRGFGQDLKPFRAHVTLARKVVHPTRFHDMPPVTWAAAAFALIRSRTDPEGAAYSVIESYPLDGGRGVP